MQCNYERISFELCSKKQKKNCTGSLGTGSDPGRTRFLVNIITQNSKITRRNRFPYRYNPVPGTNSREVFLHKFGTRFPVRSEPVPKSLFSKILFEKDFKHSFSYC